MKRIDWLTVIGYAGVLASLAGGLLWFGGDLREVWDPPALMIVLGGALLAVVTQLVGQDLRILPRVLSKAFVYRPIDTPKIVQDMVRLAAIARKDGVLALEKEAQTVGDEFLRKCLLMAVDGMSPDTIESMMTLEMRNMQERHDSGRRVFEMFATLCPAFGMLGTIMGLILVLKNLREPGRIGPSMALSLLSTWYGILGCYAIFTPLARKLEKRSREELFAKRLILHGIIAIQAGDSPRVVERKLDSFLQNRPAEALIRVG